MGNTCICTACKGAGFIKVPGRKQVVKPEKDPWDEYEGHNHQLRVCEKCDGRGVIYLTH